MRINTICNGFWWFVNHYILLEVFIPEIYLLSDDIFGRIYQCKLYFPCQSSSWKQIFKVSVTMNRILFKIPFLFFGGAASVWVRACVYVNILKRECANYCVCMCVLYHLKLQVMSIALVLPPSPCQWFLALHLPFAI